MTIQEAIRSGKPFRRKGWPDEDIWCEGAPCYDDVYFADENDPDHDMQVNVRDIMSNDWEIKQ